MAKKVQFASKIGLIAATVGSAVGLGNVWRFPAETQANGGAAFLIVYIMCVMLLGIPVMLGEFALGRQGGSDAVTDYRRLSSPGSKWWIVGWLGLLASYIILCFYMVVSGWTLTYLVNSVTGDLFAPFDTIAQADTHFQAKMQQYIHGDVMPLVYTLIMLGINFGVLLMGVRKGIERLSNALMPLLFVLLVVFVLVVLSLHGSGAGIEFFLRPDFSKITPGVVVNALGQAFFSLSLGMAILITYAAYYPKNTKLTRTACTVSLLDLMVAMLMGIIIFPAVSAFGMQGADMASDTLVFVTLPEVFQQMQGTRFWAVLFFLLLTVAALTSTISMAEVAVRYFEDRHGMSRRKAVATVMLPLVVFSSVCCLSQGPLSDFHILGMSVFDFLDTVATNFMLPIGALAMCIFIGWRVDRKFLKRQLTNDGTLHSPSAPLIAFLIRWVAPVGIFLILLSQFIKF